MVCVYGSGVLFRCVGFFCGCSRSFSWGDEFAGSCRLIVAGGFVSVLVVGPVVMSGCISGSRCCCVFRFVLGSCGVFLVGAVWIVARLPDGAAVCGDGYGCR